MKLSKGSTKILRQLTASILLFMLVSAQDNCPVGYCAYCEVVRVGNNKFNSCAQCIIAPPKEILLGDNRTKVTTCQFEESKDKIKKTSCYLYSQKAKEANPICAQCSAFHNYPQAQGGVFKCFYCDQKYNYYDELTKTCIKRGSAPQNCLVLSPIGNRCFTCKAGYTLNTKSGLCIQVNNCITAYDNNLCSLCRPHCILNFKSKCECSSTYKCGGAYLEGEKVICSKCIDGYELENKGKDGETCKKVRLDYCAEYATNNTTKCGKCIEESTIESKYFKRYLKDGICSQIEGCTSIDGDNGCCTQCYYQKSYYGVGVTEITLNTNSTQINGVIDQGLDSITGQNQSTINCQICKYQTTIIHLQLGIVQIFFIYQILFK